MLHERSARAPLRGAATNRSQQLYEFIGGKGTTALTGTVSKIGRVPLVGSTVDEGRRWRWARKTLRCSDGPASLRRRLCKSVM